MQTYTAFIGEARLSSGRAADVAAAIRALGPAPAEAVLVFDDETGRQIDLDLREAAGDAPAMPPRGRGRPSLGVVAREVTLLPRHWDWLSRQPEGASAALRKLVDAARAAEGGDARARMTAAYQFMQAMCGNRAGYEEALRALFAGDDARFRHHVASWPPAVRDHAARLAGYSK